MDPKAMIMVELDPAALRLLTAEEYSTVTPWTSAHNSLGPLRLTSTSAPSWTSEAGQVYHVELRREQAMELRGLCEGLADVLKTFPEERDRENGLLLERAARAFEYALKVSEPPK